MKKLLILLILCLQFNVYSEGKYFGHFLELGGNGRMVGMGRAFTAVLDDPDSFYSNPASIAFVDQFSLGAMGTRMDWERQYNFISTSFPNSWGNIGFSGGRFSVSEIPVTHRDTNTIVGYDSNGNPYYDIVLDGYTRDVSTFLSSTIGWKYSEKTSFGINIRYMEEVIADYKSQSTGFDLGFAWKIHSRINLGLSVRNLMQKSEWNTPGKRTDTVPLLTTFGVSATLGQILTSLDILFRENERIRMNIGVEGVYQNLLALRAGLHEGDLTLGAGLKLSDGWSLDYVYEDNTLGNEHRFSTTFSFGKAEKSEREDIKREISQNLPKPINSKERELVKSVEKIEDKPEVKQENLAILKKEFISPSIEDFSRVPLLNNTEIPKNALYIGNDKTLFVSLDFLKEKLNLQLIFDNRNNLVTIEDGLHHLLLRVGDRSVMVNQKNWQQLDSPVERRNNQVWVPLFQITKLLEARVDFL